MGDLIGKLIPALPNFLIDLVDIFCGPKTFLESIDFNTKKAVPRAAAFFGICVLVSFTLDSMFAVRKQDLIPKFFSTISLDGVLFLVDILLIKLSWKIVSGKAPTKHQAVFFGYVSGIINITDSFIASIIVAFSKFIDPVHFALIVNMQDFPSLADVAIHIGFVPAEAIAMSGFVVMLLVRLIWIIVVWGAFRRLNEVGKFRAAVAFCLFLFSTWLMDLVVSNVLLAL